MFQALSNLFVFVSLASRGYPAWLRGCGFLPFHAQDNQREELKEAILKPAARTILSFTDSVGQRGQHPVAGGRVPWLKI